MNHNKDMVKKTYFLNITNWQDILNLNTDAKCLETMKLTGYSISGVPTTNGVPNYLYYNFNFMDFGVSSGWDRSDNRRGVALPLINNFQYQQLFHPLNFISNISGVTPPMNRLRYEITDSNGNPAIFTQLCLWFDVEVTER